VFARANIGKNYKNQTAYRKKSTENKRLFIGTYNTLSLNTRALSMSTMNQKSSNCQPLTTDY